jgi:uncharacterized protein YdeI (YjbR/CyaY-like superfamily)
LAAELEELVVPDAAAWRAWLERCHARPEGVWLVLAKKGAAEPTALRYEQALAEALCFGWIDGQVRRRDERSYRQRFTPRRPRSVWSERNTELAEQLIATGRMHSAGLAQVERARADGRWERAYAGPAQMRVPADLAAALAADPAAAAAFERLSAQNRYAILYRLHHLRRPGSRARRVAAYVAMLARGETLH